MFIGFKQTGHSQPNNFNIELVLMLYRKWQSYFLLGLKFGYKSLKFHLKNMVYNVSNSNEIRNKNGFKFNRHR